MVKVMGRLADRAVELLVPRSTASAVEEGCGTYFDVFCYCSGSRAYNQKCRVCANGMEIYKECTSCNIYAGVC